MIFVFVQKLFWFSHTFLGVSWHFVWRRCFDHACLGIIVVCVLYWRSVLSFLFYDLLLPHIGLYCVSTYMGIGVVFGIGMTNCRFLLIRCAMYLSTNLLCLWRHPVAFVGIVFVKKSLKYALSRIFILCQNKNYHAPHSEHNNKK